MQSRITVTIMAFGALAFAAHGEIADSVPVHDLQEVVIEAPKVIRKADMDIYHPSRSAVENSRNGLQLLDNLMIPSLSVSEALGSVQAAGQSVQIRINGRESTVDRLRALLPGSIKRVEWIDNPGLRYNGANYVLNVIVSNPTAGGSLQTEARQALNEAWGLYFADAKFNTGLSQWEAGAEFKLTENLGIHRDYNETFTYPDDTKLHRNETSRGGVVDNSFGRAWASYNFIKPDTTVFMAEFELSRNFTDRFHYKGLLSVSGQEDDLALSDIQGHSGSTPTLSLYLEQSLSDRQTLVVNFNSSYYIGQTYSDYVERPDVALPTTVPVTDIHTFIRDRNQAYAAEADYIKAWTDSRFTAGVSYTANRNRSEYENLANQVSHQRQDKVYIFGEYFRRLGKWTLTAGMGVQYTDFLFKESARGNHTWSPRPQATLTYTLNQHHNFRLNFTSWQTAPSLAETSVVELQLDGFQWRVGNQNLRTSNSYMLTFRYGFNLPRLNGIFGIRAFTSPDAITPLLYWDEQRLVTTYENSRGLQNLSFFLAPQVDIIPGWLMLSGYLQYRMERMRGTGYSLHSNAWSGNASLRLMHRGFVLSAQYRRADRDLWGEKISWGEDLNIVDLSYNYRAWQFTAGMIMPFGKYDQGSKSLSRWNSNERHMRLNMRMPYIAVRYNLQWGRRMRGAEKRVNVNAAADRSTAGGR